MNSRRSRPSRQPRPRTPAAACLAVLLAVTALTGCQPRPELTVGNQSSHDIHVKHLIVGIDPARAGDIVMLPGTAMTPSCSMRTRELVRPMAI